MPPVDPNHPYADMPHPKTVPAPGWTYGCHSSKVGDLPRGRGKWLPKPCGHSERSTDPPCAGCANQHRPAPQPQP